MSLHHHPVHVPGSVACAAISSGVLFTVSSWMVDHLQLIGAVLYVLGQAGSCYLVLRAYLNQRRPRPPGPGPLRRFLVHLLQWLLAYLQRPANPAEESTTS